MCSRRSRRCKKLVKAAEPAPPRAALRLPQWCAESRSSCFSPQLHGDATRPTHALRTAQGALLCTAVMALFLDDFRRLLAMTPIASAVGLARSPPPSPLLPPPPLPPPPLPLVPGAPAEKTGSARWSTGTLSVLGGRLRERASQRMAGLFAAGANVTASLPPELQAPLLDERPLSGKGDGAAAADRLGAASVDHVSAHGAPVTQRARTRRRALRAPEAVA